MTSEVKHSHGPWTTQHGLIYSAEGHTVASCINEDGEYPDPQRGPHDAELIAQAPAMAQEVKRLRFELSCAEDMAANLEAETLRLREEVAQLNARIAELKADIPRIENDTQNKIIDWIVSGRVGDSSKAMALYLGWGKRKRIVAHPWDPDDLNRCLLLLLCVPELRRELPRMATASPEWRGLVEDWDQIEATFIDEAGIDWYKARRAPRTYELMKAAIAKHARDTSQSGEGAGQ